MPVLSTRQTWLPVVAMDVKKKPRIGSIWLSIIHTSLSFPNHCDIPETTSIKARSLETCNVAPPLLYPPGYNAKLSIEAAIRLTYHCFQSVKSDNSGSKKKRAAVPNHDVGTDFEDVAIVRRQKTGISLPALQTDSLQFRFPVKRTTVSSSLSYYTFPPTAKNSLTCGGEIIGGGSHSADSRKKWRGKSIFFFRSYFAWANR